MSSEMAEYPPFHPQGSALDRPLPFWDQIATKASKLILSCISFPFYSIFKDFFKKV